MADLSHLRRSEVVAHLAGAQKSSRGAAGYSRWINRRIGRQLAAVAFLRGLTPNTVSVISALFTFSAITAIALFAPRWASAVPITLALLLGYAFDSADGQVARLRGGGSPDGEWLDHVFDALKASSFHIAVAVMWFRYYHLAHAAVLLLPLGFAVVASVFFFAMILSDMLRRIERGAAGQTTVTTSSVDPNEAAPVLRSLIVLPNDYGVLCICMILSPLHTAFAITYTLLFAANLVFLVVGCTRWFREMANLPTTAGTRA